MRSQPVYKTTSKMCYHPAARHSPLLNFEIQTLINREAPLLLPPIMGDDEWSAADWFLVLPVGLQNIGFSLIVKADKFVKFLEF